MQLQPHSGCLFSETLWGYAKKQKKKKQRSEKAKKQEREKSPEEQEQGQVIDS